MKAAVMRTYGGVSVLKVDEFDLPYELDDTEVLVEVRVRYDTKKSLMTHIRHPLACAHTEKSLMTHIRHPLACAHTKKSLMTHIRHPLACAHTKKSLMTHIRHPLACAYAPVHASSVNRSLKFSY